MLETTEQTAKVVETTRSYRNLAEYNLFGYNLQVGSIEVKKLAGGSLQDVSGKNFEVLDTIYLPNSLEVCHYINKLSDPVQESLLKIILSTL